MIVNLQLTILLFRRQQPEADPDAEAGAEAEDDQEGPDERLFWGGERRIDGQTVQFAFPMLCHSHDQASILHYVMHARMHDSIIYT